jgi:uncharacterized protein YbaP (TraB family)
MLRRHFNLTLGSLALGSLALRSYATGADAQKGATFWLITRGKGRIFLLGFGEAKDKAWYSPLIQRALQESADLWLEVGPEVETQDVAVKQANAKERKRLEHESGRTFFDALQPEVRARIPQYLDSLGVKRESIETLAPWRAYYVINSAFWSHTKVLYEQVFPDKVLFDDAVAQGKGVYYEMPTKMDFVRFSAAMPDAAQSEYISWLLDFIDDQRSGVNHDQFAWYAGKPAESMRNLDRMRAKYPDLYKIMQPQRNGWWAQKIAGLLAGGGTHFIGIGMLHVLGPDGIPSQLLRRGVVTPAELKENPALASFQ